MAPTYRTNVNNGLPAVDCSVTSGRHGQHQSHHDVLCAVCRHVQLVQWAPGGLGQHGRNDRPQPVSPHWHRRLARTKYGRVLTGANSANYGPAAGAYESALSALRSIYRYLDNLGLVLQRPVLPNS